MNILKKRITTSWKKYRRELKREELRLQNLYKMRIVFGSVLMAIGTLFISFGLGIIVGGML